MMRYITLRIQFRNSLHAGIHWFHEASLLKRDLIRDADGTSLHDPVHHADVFGESSTARLKSRSATHLLVRGALGERFVPAVIALTAGYVMKDDYSVSRCELINTLTHCSDDP